MKLLKENGDGIKVFTREANCLLVLLTIISMVIAGTSAFSNTYHKTIEQRLSICEKTDAEIILNVAQIRNDMEITRREMAVQLVTMQTKMDIILERLKKLK